jgi:hypothetical protein
MLDVALHQHWPPERYDALYEAAVAKYPDYLPFHFSLAQYYAARWHGSAEEQRRAVERVVERTRAKMGETMYARLNWGLQTNEMFRNGQTEWTRMKSGFERMTKDYPDAWNINHYARFACQAEDWATVSRLAATIGEEPIVTAWRGTADYYRACRDAARHMAPKS